MANKKGFRVVLTGGGTAGHVMPHLALIPSMLKKNWSLFYIGTNGIEKELLAPSKIPFYSIQA